MHGALIQEYDLRYMTASVHAFMQAVLDPVTAVLPFCFPCCDGFAPCAARACAASSLAGLPACSLAYIHLTPDCRGASRRTRTCTYVCVTDNRRSGMGGDEGVVCGIEENLLPRTPPNANANAGSVVGVVSFFWPWLGRRFSDREGQACAVQGWAWRDVRTRCGAG